MSSHPSPAPPPSPHDGEAILETWKEIASYLRRDVRTVKRWEHTRGLPVHRLPGGGTASIYARKVELDSWRATNGNAPSVAAPPTPRPAASTSATPSSIAVLPFVNLSSSPENEHFGDGLADGVITLLTAIPGLRVTARTSAFAFRGHHQDIRTIANRLGVETILEGSIQRSANRLRVSAQLIDATNGFHVWSKQFDREITEWFAVQDEIAHAIAASIHAGATDSLPQRGRGTAHREAHTLWLRGRSAFYQRRTLESLQQCRDCFSQATMLDPGYADAYLGLAEFYRVVAVLGLMPPLAIAAQGEAAVRKALEIDDSLGEAHALLGLFRGVFHYDWQSAEHCFQRALLRAPASATVHSGWAMSYLVPHRRLAEAGVSLRRALELDPLSPELYSLQAQLAMFQRDFSAAKQSAHNSLEVEPNFAFSHWLLGMIAHFEGRTAEAKEHCQRCVELYGPAPNAQVAIAALDAFMGNTETARATLDALTAQAANRYINPVMVSWIHLGLRQPEHALDALEQALAVRDPHLIHLPVKPIYDGIRGAPRFHKILQGMNLSP